MNSRIRRPLYISLIMLLLAPYGRSAAIMWENIKDEQKKLNLLMYFSKYKQC